MTGIETDKMENGEGGKWRRWKLS